MGYMKIDVKTGVNSIKGIKTGNCIIEFKDGITHHYTFPQVEVKGLSIGKRTFNYKHNMVVTDKVINTSITFVRKIILLLI